MTPPLPPAERPGTPSRRGNAFRVRFYRRMNLQRVYPLVVELPPSASYPAAPPGSPSPVIVPVVPGALVTPADQKIDPARPGTSATFFVTPIARGRLRDARVEARFPGQPTQSQPLKMRATTQRLTCWLLLLTFLLPGLLLWAMKYSGRLHVTAYVKTEDGESKERDFHNGDVVGYYVTTVLGNNIPELSDVIPNAPAVVKPTAAWLGEKSAWLYDLIKSLSEGPNGHAAFYLFLILLALTLISWVGRRPSRKTAKWSYTLPPPVPSHLQGETLPLGAREDS